MWVDTKGNYYHLPKDKHPNKGVEYHWSVLSLTGYELGYPPEPGLGRGVAEVFSWEARSAPGKNAGANPPAWPRSSTRSTEYRDTVGEIHNINALLPTVKPRTLVVHVDNDQWLISDKAQAAVAAIPGGSTRDCRARSPITRCSAPNGCATIRRSTASCATSA